MLKSLGKNTLIHGIPMVVKPMLAPISLYVFTRHLTTGDFGVLGIMAVVATIVTMAPGAVILNALLRYYNQKDMARRSVVGASITGIIVLEAAIFAAAALFSGELSEMVFGTARYADWFILAVGAAAVTQVNSILLAMLRMEKRIGRHIAIQLVEAFINLGLALYFVGVVLDGVPGIFKAGLISVLFSSVLLFGSCFRSISFASSGVEIKRMLKYGAPLAIFWVAHWVIDWSDLLVIKWYRGLGEAGLYRVGYRLGVMLNVMAGAFHLAATPYLYSVFNRENARAIYGRMATYYAFFIAVCLAGVNFVNIFYFVLLTPPQFHGAGAVVPLVALAYSLGGLCNIAAIGALIKEKTGFVLVVEIICAALNFGLNLLLVPHFGMMAAAATTAATWVLKLAAFIWMGKKVYPIKFENARLVKLGALTVAVIIALALLARTAVTPLTVAAGAAVVAAFIGSWFVFGLFTADEKSKMRVALGSILPFARRGKTGEKP